MSAREIIQVISHVLAVFAAITWIFVAKKHQVKMRSIAIAPLAYLGHVVIFYTCIWIIGLRPGVLLFTNWSSALRLHEIITLGLLGLHLLFLEFSKDE